MVEGKSLRRPSQHLYPVEVKQVDEVTEVGDEKREIVEEKAKGVGARVRRSAAIDARWKTKAMLDS